MVEADGWHFDPTEMLASQHPAMTSDDFVLPVYQYRDVKAEGLDTASNLADLPPAVGAGVALVQPQFADCAVFKAKAAQRCGLALAGGVEVVESSTNHGDLLLLEIT
jgi:hypothetical protein